MTTDTVDSDRCCWLCLSSAPLEVVDCSRSCDEGRCIQLQELTLPCKCPHLYSHPVCLARWQLRKAGQEEEHICRFCKAELPHWSEALLRAPTKNDGNRIHTVPMMTVTCRGRKALLPCYPGKRGELLFQMLVRSVFHVDSSIQLHARFKFKESELLNGLPTDSEGPQQDATAANVVCLDGIGAFDAACRVATELAERKRAAMRRRLAAESQTASMDICGGSRAANAVLTQDSPRPSSPIIPEQSRRRGHVGIANSAAPQPEQVEPEIVATLNHLPQATGDAPLQEPLCVPPLTMPVRQTKRSWAPSWMVNLSTICFRQPQVHQ